MRFATTTTVPSTAVLGRTEASQGDALYASRECQVRGITIPQHSIGEIVSIIDGLLTVRDADGLTASVRVEDIPFSVHVIDGEYLPRQAQEEDEGTVTGSVPLSTVEAIATRYVREQFGPGYVRHAEAVVGLIRDAMR